MTARCKRAQINLKNKQRIIATGYLQGRKQK